MTLDPRVQAFAIDRGSGKPAALEPRAVARALGGEASGNSVRFPTPGHNKVDRGSSLTIDPNAPGGFLINSFNGADALAVKDHVRQVLGLPAWEPERVGIIVGTNPATEYIYRDADGRPSRKVVRTADKQFPQYHWTGSEWKLGAKGLPLLPYRLPELLASTDPVFICEGEKDVDRLAALGFTATTNPMGAGKWKPDLDHWFQGRECFILADNDDVGRDHAAAVAKHLSSIAASSRVVELPGLPEKGDVSDWLDADPGNASRLLSVAREASEPHRAPVMTLSEWMERDLPEPDFLMGEWLSTTSRAMIVGPTGLGKTNFGLGLAISVSAGNGFLHWRGYRPCSVLYIDGEMSRRLMKKRLQDAVWRAGVAPDGLMILSKEDAENMPPLNTVDGQKFVDSLILDSGPFDLIIFDNIQALLEGDMKDEEQWGKVLPWARSLTRRSIGQIWFHHTGHDETKSYGSKAREWQLDIVALMERVEHADADIAFTLKFTKARERSPDNRADFEPVTMLLRNGRWEHDRQGAKPVAGATKVALDLLRRAIADAGERAPGSNHIPPDKHVVRVSLWRDYCYKGSVTQGDTPDSRQKAFARASRNLQASGKINVWDDWVWLV